MAGDNGHLGNAYGQFYTGIGTRPDRPFKILAPITTLSFGDVFIYASAAARIASAFDHSHCDFLVDHRRPYFKDILALYPFDAELLIVEDDWRRLPFVALSGPTTNLDWTEKAYHDLVLSNGFISSAHFEDLPRCALRIPDRDAGRLTQKLVDLGLREDRWFCTMHWREPTYRFKSGGTPRDVEPDVYLPLVDHVIDGLAGQVVLLGHPEMTQPRPRDGLVNLAEIEDSWVLQAFAMSRARFFAGSPSGATGMAHAFLTPSAHLDVTDWYTGGSDDWVLTPTIRLPDGRAVRQKTLFESGWMQSKRIADGIRNGEAISIEQSSTDEMRQAVSRIHQDTEDLAGWRMPAAPALERPNRIMLPPSGNAIPRFLPL